MQDGSESRRRERTFTHTRTVFTHPGYVFDFTSAFQYSSEAAVFCSMRDSSAFVFCALSRVTDQWRAAFPENSHYSYLPYALTHTRAQSRNRS